MANLPKSLKIDTLRSTQNARVKNLVKLRDGKHRRRQRKFIIEGRREIERALKKNTRIEELYIGEEFLGGRDVGELLMAADSGDCQLCRLTPEVFRKASIRENPDGLMAVAPMWDLSLGNVSLSVNPLVLIVEKVEKPGNLGALLRIADGVGADAVIFTDPVTDVFSPNVIRTSQGALFAQPIAESSNEEVLKWLQENGITVFATTPRAENEYWEADYSGPSAILLGSEDNGLSDFWLTEAGIIRPVKIPMLGLSDSLNVSAASAVFLYEAVRQRAVGA